MNPEVTILCGEAVNHLQTLPDESVQCCITSPPYWGLRDYGNAGQIGLEKTPDEYVAKMVEVFREVRRVLKNDGTLWLNLGDSYCSQGGLHDGREDQPGVGASRVWRNGSGRADGIVDERGQRNRNGNSVAGLKPKDLVGIPWMVAFALRADGWWLRQDIIWSKPNPMPESVTDRCTKAHEYLFLMSKSARYYYDAEAIAEPSITNDIRRPYGSEGAWQMDGRPDEQKHGGEPRKTAVIRRPNPNRNDLGASNIGGDDRLTRNKRSVWSVMANGYADAHFATYPPDLIKPCILAGTKAGDTVLDPFAGSGTTGMVALELGRAATLIELNPAYVKLIEQRCYVTAGLALS